MRLRAAAGENHLLRAGTDQRGNLLADQVQIDPGRGAERVVARRVAETLPQSRQQCLEDSGSTGGRVVVQVDGFGGQGSAFITVAVSFGGGRGFQACRRTSERHHLVGVDCPLCPLVERAASRSIHESIVGDAADVHARAAHPDFGAATHDVRQHLFDVVVPARDALAGLGARAGIPDQEDPDLLALLLSDPAGEPERVVGAFGAIGGVVDDDQGLHGFVLSGFAGGRHSALAAARATASASWAPLSAPFSKSAPAVAIVLVMWAKQTTAWLRAAA